MCTPRTKAGQREQLKGALRSSNIGIIHANWQRNWIFFTVRRVILIPLSFDIHWRHSEHFHIFRIHIFFHIFTSFTSTCGEKIYIYIYTIWSLQRVKNNLESFKKTEHWKHFSLTKGQLARNVTLRFLYRQNIAFLYFNLYQKYIYIYYVDIRTFENYIII